jgi:hypothetical protein
MTEPLATDTAASQAARLRALAGYLDLDVELRAPAGAATPDDLREVADHLDRIYQGGDRDAAAQQPGA